MASRASAATGGFPAALLEVFWASIACRTAWRPPRRSCSATGICSGRRAASMALRCTVDVGATGRSPRAGRPSPSPGRRAPGRRGPPAPRGGRSPPRSSRRPSPSGPRRFPPPRRSPRSPRSPSSSRSRRRLLEPGARMTETSGARLGVPLTSMRPSVFSGERAGFAEASDRISMPSRPISTSARNTAPTASPGGTRAASTVPLGWRAPAARQVHDPSPDWLVNSMSILRDMRRTRYLAWSPCPMPGRDRHPVTWPQDVRMTAGAIGASHPLRHAVQVRHAPFRRIHMSEDTEQPGTEPAAGTPQDDAAVPPPTASPSRRRRRSSP